MRVSALLFGTTVACLVSAVPSMSAIISGAVSKGSISSNSSGTSFVVAPYTAGSTQLFTSSIVNVSNAIAGTLPPLSGNNAGSAPQGGLGSKQGGLGFATIGVAITKGSVADSSLVGNTNSTSSAGFSSVNNTSGTSSSGFSSANNTSGTSSSGFSSANYTSGTSSSGFSSANNTSGTSSSGFSSANNTSGTSSRGFSSANNTSGTSSAGSSNTFTAPNFSAGARPLLVLTSLVNSTDPRSGSAGAVFQGVANTQISSLSFQFGSVAAAAGQSGAASSVSPLLAIDDQPNGSAVTTRYIPMSSGTIDRNSAGLTTVTFNANQLRTTGQVQRVGVVLTQRGTVAIDNVRVNGVASSGILAQAQQSFPF